MNNNIHNMAFRTATNVVSCNNTKHNFSRYEMLNWCNGLLDSSVQKIDDLCTGAAYCGLLNKLFPDSINLRRVKYNTPLETHWIHNFTLLQQALNKLKVDKAVPIEKLVKGKYQDNYEFAIWFRRFYDANSPKPKPGPLPGLFNRYATEPDMQPREHVNLEAVETSEPEESDGYNNKSF